MVPVMQHFKRVIVGLRRCSANVYLRLLRGLDRLVEKDTYRPPARRARPAVAPAILDAENIELSKFGCTIRNLK
jgi:hypothetical protein